MLLIKTAGAGFVVAERNMQVAGDFQSGGFDVLRFDCCRPRTLTKL